MIKMRDSRGFSLIELIIVIVILGVLVGIAVPSYLNYLEMGKEARDEANIKKVLETFELAVIDPKVTISEGIIYYQKDGVLRGIGVTLTGKFEEAYGSAGRTSPGNKGFKVEPLQSQKYMKEEPQFDFRWSDQKTKGGYIVVTYKNPK